MEGVLRLCDACLIIYLIFELLSIALPLRSHGHAMNRIAEYNSAGTLQTKYTHGPGIDEPLARTQTPYIFLSCRCFGQYYGFNKYQWQAGTGIHLQFFRQDHPYRRPQRFLYHRSALRLYREEYDPESGLYFYRARYYDPQAGGSCREIRLGLGGVILIFMRMWE